MSKRGANFHSAWSSIEVLCIECTGCNRRAALTHEELPAIYQGNMRAVASAKFRCRKCGPTPVRSYIPVSEEQVAMFLAGDPLPESRRVM
jgi:hypothetical protein